MVKVRRRKIRWGDGVRGEQTMLCVAYTLKQSRWKNKLWYRVGTVECNCATDNIPYVYRSFVINTRPSSCEVSSHTAGLSRHLGLGISGCTSSTHRDGASRSGLFCAASHLLGSLTVDQYVDVFHSAQHVRNKWPQAIDSLVCSFWLVYHSRLYKYTWQVYLCTV